MKDLKMLVWLTQLGLSTSLPPAVCCVIGIRLHRVRGFGGWTVWAGLILGMYLALCNFRDSLIIMKRMAEAENRKPSDTSFSDHS